MLFRITIKGADTIAKWLRNLGSLFRSERTTAEIAEFIRAQILLRTAKGVDANAMAFKPYSKRYRLYREKYGHPTSKVNLFWYGTMLSAIDYEAVARSVRLFIRPTESPPYPRSIKNATRDKESPNSALKAYFIETARTKPRTFFAFSKTDVEGIADLILARIDEITGA